MNSMKRQKDMTSEDYHHPPRSDGVLYATGEKQRAITNSSTKNEAQGQVETTLSCVSGGEGEVQCWKEQYCLGTCGIGEDS